MASPVSAPIAHQADVAPRDGISFTRLLWVAPLTLVVAVAVNYAIKFIAQQLNPAYLRMPQLQEPMVILTIEGVIAAVLVFVVVALFVPRPIFWYRTIGVCALVLSLLPDIALATGGQPMFMSMRTAGMLTSIGMGGPGGAGGPPPGGGPGGPGGGPGAGQGGPPPGVNFTIPMEQVLLLMLLHIATAVVCIVLLTTLTRRQPNVETALPVAEAVAK